MSDVRGLSWWLALRSVGKARAKLVACEICDCSRWTRFRRLALIVTAQVQVVVLRGVARAFTTKSERDLKNFLALVHSFVF